MMMTCNTYYDGTISGVSNNQIVKESWSSWGTGLFCLGRIDHFQVLLGLCMKTRLSAQPSGVIFPSHANKTNVMMR